MITELVNPLEIPKGWEICIVDDLIKNKKDLKTGPFGSSLKKETFVLKGYKVYGQENVIPDDFLLGNYYISEKHFRQLKEYEVKPNDVLISLVGTHGKVSLAPIKMEKGIINPRLIRIRFNQSKVLPQYIKILFNSHMVQSQIKKFVHGLTMDIMNISILRKIKFVIPPLPEQQNIVDIIYDTDELIQKFDQIILKKKNIKNGSIQNLVFGKKRLSGFNEKWIPTTLEACFTLITGKSMSQFVEKTGKYLVMDMGSVSIEGENISQKYTNNKEILLQFGDLIMPKDDIGGGNIIGKTAFIDENNKYVLGDHVYLLKTKNSMLDPKFFFYLINSFKINKELRKKVVGSAQLGINKKSIGEQPIEIPKNVKEQSIISHILTDMDNEIDQLKKNREKYILIKDGMIQKLLTGEIRLK